MLVANCGSNGPQTCAIHLVQHCACLKYIAIGKKEEKKKTWNNRNSEQS